MSIRSAALAAVAAAAAFQLAAAAPAAAQTVDTVAVPYADLNLANRIGRDILDRRIAAAATQLCGEFGPLELRWRMDSRACQSATIAAAQPQRDAAIGLRGTVRISSTSGFLSVSRAAN